MPLRRTAVAPIKLTRQPRPPKKVKRPKNLVLAACSGRVPSGYEAEGQLCPRQWAAKGSYGKCMWCRGPLQEIILIETRYPSIEVEILSPGGTRQTA